MAVTEITPYTGLVPKTPGLNEAEELQACKDFREWEYTELAVKLVENTPEINKAIEYKDILFDSSRFKGEFDIQTTYQIGESVSVGNDIYISKLANNQSTPPNSSWVLLYSTQPIDANGIQITSVYDGLDSLDSTKALSAKQGNFLNETNKAQTQLITLNTAKVSNVTHTGDVLGDTILRIQPNKVLEGMLSEAVQIKLNPPVGTSPVIFQNGWVDYPGVTFGPVTIKRFNNQVFIQGIVRSGGIGQVVFNLPVGFRPSISLILAAATSSSEYGELRIFQNGDVTAHLGSNTWVSVSCNFHV